MDKFNIVLAIIPYFEQSIVLQWNSLPCHLKYKLILGYVSV